MTVTFQTSVPPSWPTIRELRMQVRQALSDLPDSLRANAEMVAAELLENAVKYGEDTPGCPEVTLHVAANADAITIEVANGVKDPQHFERLRERVTELCEADDKSEPYMRRAQEFLGDSCSGSGLGIYRIGFEGQFELEYRREGDTLRVTATRTLR